MGSASEGRSYNRHAAPDPGQGEADEIYGGLQREAVRIETTGCVAVLID